MSAVLNDFKTASTQEKHSTSIVMITLESQHYVSSIPFLLVRQHRFGNGQLVCTVCPCYVLSYSGDNIKRFCNCNREEKINEMTSQTITSTILHLLSQAADGTQLAANCIFQRKLCSPLQSTVMLSKKKRNTLQEYWNINIRKVHYIYRHLGTVLVIRVSWSYLLK